MASLNQKLDAEETAELVKAITFYLDGHRASNENMRFFLIALIAQLKLNAKQ